jgi:hypothetical protein
MTLENDVETQTSHNENTPLLVGEQSGQSLPDRQESERKSTGWYLWRIFLIIVVALVLAVFIKAWVDADGEGDVKVSPKSWFLATYTS